MPATVQRLAGEPIVVATLSGYITVGDILTVYEETARLTEDVIGNIYRITNVLQADSSFGEIMSIIREASRGGRGSTTDPNITAIFVGTSHWLDFARQALSQPQFGGLHLAMFTELSDALEHARDLLKRTTNIA